MEKAEGRRVFRSVVRVIPTIMCDYGLIYAEVCRLSERNPDLEMLKGLSERMADLDLLIVQVAEDILRLAKMQMEAKNATTEGSGRQNEGSRTQASEVAGSSDNSRYPCKDVEESSPSPTPLFTSSTG